VFEEGGQEVRLTPCAEWVTLLDEVQKLL